MKMIDTGAKVQTDPVRARDSKRVGRDSGFFRRSDSNPLIVGSTERDFREFWIFLLTI